MLLKRAVDSSWTSDTPPSNLTRLQAVDAIRCRPREEHADRPFVTVLGERLQEHVDGSMPLPDRLDRVDQQRAGADQDIRFRRGHVHGVGLDVHGVGHLDDPHRRRPRQQRGQHRLVKGIEVLDEHDRETAPLGQRLEQLAKRLVAPGGRANPDDHERDTGGLLDLRGLGARLFRFAPVGGSGFVHERLRPERIARGHVDCTGSYTENHATGRGGDRWFGRRGRGAQAGDQLRIATG